MRRHPRSSAERMAGLLALLLALAAGLSTAACGGSPAPPSPPPSTTSLSTAPPRPVELLSTEDAEPFSRSAERLELPYRQYRLTGSLTVADATDQTAALERNVPEGGELLLMDTATGRTRLVFSRATYRGSPGYWISGVRLSDGWIAWEELGPGDDLIEEVPWRLYAARLDRASLAVGKPQLVASALNTEGARPLFDVSGSRLAWVTTGWTKAGKVASSRLTVCDLASGQRRVLYRSHGVLETVGFRRGEVIVSEAVRQGSPASRFTVLDIGTGRRLAVFDAANEHPLSHWPAWRGGWLAWAPFPDAEATFPQLYLRNGAGRVFTEGGFAVDPCFVGGYLFFRTQRSGPPMAGATVELRALRLSDMTSLVLVSTPIDDGWWGMAIGAPELERTFIAYRDNILTATSRREWRTTIRVYRVP